MFDYVLPGGLSQKCTDTELSLALHKVTLFRWYFCARFLYTYSTMVMNANHGVLIVGGQKVRPSMTLRLPSLDDFTFAAIVVHSLHPATWGGICVRERHIKNIVPLFENDIRAYSSRTSAQESKTLFKGVLQMQAHLEYGSSTSDITHCIASPSIYNCR
jgi:hypothetical protein